MSHSKLNSAVQNQPREKYATLVLTELPFGAAAVAEARAAASRRVGHMKLWNDESENRTEKFRK